MDKEEWVFGDEFKAFCGESEGAYRRLHEIGSSIHRAPEDNKRNVCYCLEICIGA